MPITRACASSSIEPMIIPRRRWRPAGRRAETLNMEHCASQRPGVRLAVAIGYPRGVSSPEGDATLTAMDRPGEPVSLAELGAGARIGRYVIAKRLGAGGMGVVYVAR